MKKTEPLTKSRSYKIRVDMLFKKFYGCDSNVLMIPDESIEQARTNKETPLEYVEWYGEKYDLIRK